MPGKGAPQRIAYPSAHEPAEEVRNQEFGESRARDGMPRKVQLALDGAWAWARPGAGHGRGMGAAWARKWRVRARSRLEITSRAARGTSLAHDSGSGGLRGIPKGTTARPIRFDEGEEDSLGASIRRARRIRNRAPRPKGPPFRASRRGRFGRPRRALPGPGICGRTSRAAASPARPLSRHPRSEDRKGGGLLAKSRGNSARREVFPGGAWAQMLGRSISIRMTAAERIPRVPPRSSLPSSHC